MAASKTFWHHKFDMLNTCNFCSAVHIDTCKQSIAAIFKIQLTIRVDLWNPMKTISMATKGLNIFWNENTAHFKFKWKLLWVKGPIKYYIKHVKVLALKEKQTWLKKLWSTCIYTRMEAPEMPRLKHSCWKAAFQYNTYNRLSGYPNFRLNSV